MKIKSRKGLKCLLAVAAVAVIAVIVYFTSFHNADILKIQDGKVRGIKPTWLLKALPGRSVCRIPPPVISTARMSSVKTVSPSTLSARTPWKP